MYIYILYIYRERERENDTESHRNTQNINIQLKTYQTHENTFHFSKNVRECMFSKLNVLNIQRFMLICMVELILLRVTRPSQLVRVPNEHTFTNTFKNTPFTTHTFANTFFTVRHGLASAAPSQSIVTWQASCLRTPFTNVFTMTSTSFKTSSN